MLFLPTILEKKKLFQFLIGHRRLKIIRINIRLPNIVDNNMSQDAYTDS